MKVTTINLEEVYGLVCKGLNMEQIANELGLTSPKLRLKFKELGTNYSEVCEQAKINMIVKLHDKGMTVPEISDHINLCTSSIYRYLKYHKLKQFDRVAMVKNLYLQGISVTEISEKSGLCNLDVHNVITLITNRQFDNNTKKLCIRTMYEESLNRNQVASKLHIPIRQMRKMFSEEDELNNIKRAITLLKIFKIEEEHPEYTTTKICNTVGIIRTTYYRYKQNAYLVGLAQYVKSVIEEDK